MSLNLIAQIVGIIAVVLSLAVFQLNKRHAMLLLAMTAAFLYALHFFLLGAATGAAMNLIGAFRCYVFYKVKPTRSNAWILYVFITISLLATLYTWQGPISLLAAAGTVLSGIASWQLTPKYIRRYALSAPPPWFAYNALSGSYPGMFIEVFMFISNLIGQYRFDLKPTSRLRRKLARPA